MPEEFWYVHFAHYLGIGPWEFEGRSVYWQKMIDLHEQVMRRAPAIAKKIQKQRAEVRGESADDEDEDEA